MRTLIKKLPGPKSLKVISKLKMLNGGWNEPYPYVHSSQGQGCYFKDIDNNIFLDFASQISSNPLGYNHPDIKNVIKRYRNTPIKYAGQDFIVKEHLDLLEELLSITPRNLNAAFLINSGAEAVENSIKICMRYRPKTKFGIHFQGSFHGRTLGALSLTSSKPLYTKNYLKIPTKSLPFDDTAPKQLLKTINQSSASEIGFVILEHIQGEGGYNIAPLKMVREIRKITRDYRIPLIADEVQSGLGRTGKWWAFQHYNIAPDVISAAKALQVGATISNYKMFPAYKKDYGAISSTWGGGHTLDLATGIQVIKTIKKHKLLNNVNKMGSYLENRLSEIKNPNIRKVRGLGLMVAFDLQSKDLRDNLAIELLKNGLVTIGCGIKGIRLIPPYIVTKKEIDEACSIIEKSIKTVSIPRFKHKGKICNYLTCAETHI